MKHCMLVAVVAALAILVTQGASAQPDVDYALSFNKTGDCGGEVRGEGVYQATLDCVLTTSNNNTGTPGDRPGAQGWSLSIAEAGLVLTDITVAGTVAADVNDDPPGIRNTGFEKSELTATGPNPASCEGGVDGAVAALVLSFTLPIDLEEDFSGPVAKIGGEADFPEAGQDPITVGVAYVDGCQGSGQPVDNNVTHQGQTVKPELGSCQITLAPCDDTETDCNDGVDNDCDGDIDCDDRDCAGVGDPPCPIGPVFCPDLDDPGDLTLIIQTKGSNEESLELFAGMAPAVMKPDPDGEGEIPDYSQPALVVAPPGEVEVYAAIVSKGLPVDKQGRGGVQGWSLSIPVDAEGGATLTGATTVGTVGGDVNDFPPGKRNTGFEKTELTADARQTCIDEGGEECENKRCPGGLDGAVSAVVLSFTLPITLEVTGTASVLKLTFEGEVGQGASLSFDDFCQGSGQPVKSVATIGGATEKFEDTPETPGRCAQKAEIVFVEPPVANFIRCDANADLTVNVADAVWIVNELFRGGPPTECQAAADCNNDNLWDLSDAVYLVQYRWLGGLEPQPPFPDCGGGLDLPDPSWCPADSTPCPPPVP